MTKKTLLASLALALLLPASASAAELICTRPDSTRSFAIKLNSYQDENGDWAAVRVMQYPGEKTLFYRTIGSNAKVVHLNNKNIYFQADQDLIIHTKNGKVTLETFWIRGPTGFGMGGESGSFFLPCN